MNNRGGLLAFAVLVVLFAFTFVFCLDALSASNTTYGVLALFGYIVCIAIGLMQGSFARKAGEALSVWYYSYAVIVSIVFVWYLTRCGTTFKFW